MTSLREIRTYVLLETLLVSKSFSMFLQLKNQIHQPFFSLDITVSSTIPIETNISSKQVNERVVTEKDLNKM